MRRRTPDPPPFSPPLFDPLLFNSPSNRRKKSQLLRPSSHPIQLKPPPLTHGTHATPGRLQSLTEPRNVHRSPKRVLFPKPIKSLLFRYRQSRFRETDWGAWSAKSPCCGD